MVACAFSSSRGKRKITKLWVEPLVGDLIKSSLSSYFWVPELIQSFRPVLPALLKELPWRWIAWHGVPNCHNFSNQLFEPSFCGISSGAFLRTLNLDKLWSEPSLQIYHWEHFSGLWISNDKTVNKPSHCEHHWPYPPIIRMAYALGDSPVQKPAEIAPSTLSSSHYPLWTTGLK